MLFRSFIALLAVNQGIVQKIRNPLSKKLKLKAFKKDRNCLVSLCQCRTEAELSAEKSSAAMDSLRLLGLHHSVVIAVFPKQPISCKAKESEVQCYTW